MREIKFRGRSVETGEMVYGSLINNMFFKTDTGAPVQYIVDPDQYENYSSFEDIEHLVVEVDPETVGQLTPGKNSVEIYEGDIVKQTYHQETRDDNGEWISFDGDHTGVVIITAKGVCIKNPLHYSVETDETTKTKMYKPLVRSRAVVIGNIHDHPHLLEVGP